MQKDNIKIEHANITDAKQISEIDKMYISEPWSEKAFLDAIKSPSDIIFKAVLNENPIGFIEVSYVLDEVNINSVAVKEEYRNKGIAQMLINKIQEEVIVFASRIMLEVRSKNYKAISLYRKLGFHEDGIRKNFYTHPDDDALLMSKNL